MYVVKKDNVKYEIISNMTFQMGQVGMTQGH